MTISRYWRLVGIATPGNADLELSEVRLYEAGVLVDAAATLTATVGPASGALADLRDGVATGVVSWPYASYSQPGFALVWDFGVGGGVNIPMLRLGSGSNLGSWPLDAMLQTSLDGTNWSAYSSIAGIVYPGSYAMTTLAGASSLATGLVSYWPLDESSGDVVNDKVGPNTGTAYGPEIVGGKVGNARSFSGTGKRISLPMSGFPTDSISICFWAAPANAASTSVLISNPDEPTNKVNIHLPWGSGTIYWDFGNTSSGRLSASFDSSWFNVMAFWEFSSVAGTGMKIYRNRVLLASSGTTSTFNPTGKTLNLGYYAPGGTYWAGVLDEVAVFARALTPSEANELYNGGYGASISIGMTIPANYEPRASRLAPSLERLLPAANLPVTSAHGHLREFPFFDAFNGGVGVIAGTVKEKGAPSNTPLARKVWLIDEASGMVVRETWSDAVTGNYEFRGIKQGVRYTTLAYDHLNNYRAVIADNLTLANGGVELLP